MKRTIDLQVFPTRDEMGKAAAREAARSMARFIREKGRVNVVFAAAPSQDEFLAHLSRMKNIESPAHSGWQGSRVLASILFFPKVFPALDPFRFR